MRSNHSAAKNEIVGPLWAVFLVNSTGNATQAHAGSLVHSMVFSALEILLQLENGQQAVVPIEYLRHGNGENNCRHKTQFAYDVVHDVVVLARLRGVLLPERLAYTFVLCACAA